MDRQIALEKLTLELKPPVCRVFNIGQSRRILTIHRRTSVRSNTLAEFLMVKIVLSMSDIFAEIWEIEEAEIAKRSLINLSKVFNS